MRSEKIRDWDSLRETGGINARSGDSFGKFGEPDWSGGLSAMQRPFPASIGDKPSTVVGESDIGNRVERIEPITEW